MDAGGPLLEVGHGIGEAVILFTKVADEQIAAQRAKLEDSGRPAAEPEDPAEAPYAPIAPEMVFDDFAKMDLRVGEIVLAEPVPKADKLLRLVVNLGFEERQILSGIATFFDPQAIVGKRVVVVANLAPRKMRGLLSEGMILMAEDRQGQLSFVESDGEPGSVVR
jgi:methionyl-tRNA synthetase